MRTVIYARFSSDNQNPRSVTDQIALCRERAEREGWPIVAVFEDSAISGAAGIDQVQRPGLHAWPNRPIASPATSPTRIIFASASSSPARVCSRCSMAPSPRSSA
jgi:hypothetical protein